MSHKYCFCYFGGTCQACVYKALFCRPSIQNIQMFGSPCAFYITLFICVLILVGTVLWFWPWIICCYCSHVNSATALPVFTKGQCAVIHFLYWTCTRGRNLSDVFSMIWKQCFLKWSVYRWINRFKNNSTYTWSRMAVVTIHFHYGWEHWLNPYHDLE